MAALLVKARNGLASARAERDRAVVAEAATMRVLRLSVGDLRGAAMRLLGHAEQISLNTQEAPQDVAGVLAMTRQLLDLADDVQDNAVPGASTRVLHNETIPLEPALADAITGVTATLGPSRRHWRVAPDVAGCVLTADRRALAQVLGRVLGNAARQSRHGDWIDISLMKRAEGVALVVEDEGAGLVAPQRIAPPGQQESRGLGLGLVLTRVLMEAHGGSLAIESAARVGSRVMLRFPSDRVAQLADNVTRVPFAA